MLCFIRLFQKNIVYFILALIAIGLIFGQYYSLPDVKLIKQTALYIMLIPVFINLDFLSGLKEFKHFYKVIGIASLLNLLIYTLIAYFIGFIFLQESPTIWFGLVLMSLVPTSAKLN
jgi:ACR3 family arsenite efflux pump ArsB